MSIRIKPRELDTPQDFPMWVGGQRREAISGEALDVSDPFTGKVWARVPAAASIDVDLAVRSAREAFVDGPWAVFSAAERAACLRRLGVLIADSAGALAMVQVCENGKLYRETFDQIRGLEGFCNFFAGLAETNHGASIDNIPDTHIFTRHEPIGVVAAIAPWNSPLSLLMWKLCPALAAGCTIVAKPSEVTPVSTLLLAELIEEAGFPSGVFNVVTGAGDVGAALVDHPLVDKIAFTGSTSIGKRIAGSAASRLARVSLELGGKSANIVFADADLPAALNGVIAGIFAAAGQTCLAGSRVLIERSIYDQFSRQLATRAAAIKLGDPLDEDTQMGPIACAPQLEKVLHYLKLGASEGADVLAGGSRSTDPELKSGLFVDATVFGNATNDMKIAREEVFGPVATLIPFETEQEAVSLANDTDFGLAGGVWTQDFARAFRVAGQIRAGTVWINTFRKSNYLVPFGGYKQSGIGRENGVEAIREYTETKAIWVNAGVGIADPFNPRAMRSDAMA